MTAAAALPQGVLSARLSVPHTLFLPFRSSRA